MEAARVVLGGWSDPRELDESAAGLGLRIVRDEPADDFFRVWPENAAAYRVFRRMRRQWLTGPGGVFALRHDCLPLYMRAEGLGDEHLPGLLDELEVMEASALTYFDEQREQRRGQ